MQDEEETSEYEIIMTSDDEDEEDPSSGPPETAPPHTQRDMPLSTQVHIIYNFQLYKFCWFIVFFVSAI